MATMGKGGPGHLGVRQLVALQRPGQACSRAHRPQDHVEVISGWPLDNLPQVQEPAEKGISSRVPGVGPLQVQEQLPQSKEAMAALGGVAGPVPVQGDAGQRGCVRVASGREEFLGDHGRLVTWWAQDCLDLLPAMCFYDLAAPQGLPLPLWPQGLVQHIPGLFLPNFLVAVLHHFGLPPRGEDLAAEGLQESHVAWSHPRWGHGEHVQQLGHWLGGQGGGEGGVLEERGASCLLLAGLEGEEVIVQVFQTGPFICGLAAAEQSQQARPGV
eukprot:2075113-Lingulodinium_polyedra.AAC.1